MSLISTDGGPIWGVSGEFKSPWGGEAARFDAGDISYNLRFWVRLGHGMDGKVLGPIQSWLMRPLSSVPCLCGGPCTPPACCSIDTECSDSALGTYSTRLFGDPEDQSFSKLGITPLTQVTLHHLSYLKLIPKAGKETKKLAISDCDLVIDHKNLCLKEWGKQ